MGRTTCHQHLPLSSLLCIPARRAAKLPGHTAKPSAIDTRGSLAVAFAQRAGGAPSRQKRCPRVAVRVSAIRGKKA